MIEIVKREYLLLNSRKGKGLWQYNHSSSYTRQEVNAWEEQQRQRKVAGAFAKGKGKGKAVTKASKEGGSKSSVTIAGQPGNTQEPQVPRAESANDNARGDQVLQDLLTGAKQ